MPWIRYSLYFVAVAVITGLLTQMEIAAPGSLKMRVLVNPGDVYGTSEYSPVEIVQAIILATCGGVMAWVVRYCPSQRPVAILFGGMALAYLIRELDYFLDLWLVDNLWQVLVVVVSALVIAYTYRQRKRLTIAFGRLWPSPAIALLFAGALVLFAFVRFVGHEPLWQALLGDDYRRVIKLGIEEFMELMGYFLWMVGSIEYAIQARAIAYREPQPAARKRRERRRSRSERPY